MFLSILCTFFLNSYRHLFKKLHCQLHAGHCSSGGWFVHWNESVKIWHTDSNFTVNLITPYDRYYVGYMTVWKIIPNFLTNVILAFILCRLWSFSWPAISVKRSFVLNSYWKWLCKRAGWWGCSIIFLQVVGRIGGSLLLMNLSVLERDMSLTFLLSNISNIELLRWWSTSNKINECTSKYKVILL